MVQPITDNITFLTEAGQAVKEVSQLCAKEEELKTREKQLEKALEAEKKTVADSISITIKKRVESITSSYDQEINKGQERLKKARSKREKAKNQGVKERITEETAELHEDNRQLKLQIKTLFQQSHVPKFCNTNLYYALYFPRHFFEVLILLGMIALTFLLIPCAIYECLPRRIPMFLVVIYFATILMFGGIYIYISNHTKLHHLEVLKQGRIIRDQIFSNHKKVKVITHTVLRDRNEAAYNLQRFDDEIAKIEQELADMTNQKKDALNTFETVTKTILSDEITNNSKVRMDQLQSDYEDTLTKIEETQGQRKEKSLHVTDHYETYLSKDFLNPDKIEQLIHLIQTGTATNITEAISAFKDLEH